MHNQPIVPGSASSSLGVSTVRMRNLSDEDVMQQLRQGHAEALVILFDRFYRLVLKVALKILRDPAEAEDVMQDVFLEIFNKVSQFDPSRGSARTWILQYAYHRSLSRRQYLALRSYYDRREVTEAEISEANSLNRLWRGLTFQEWRRVLQQGLATLSDKQRRTIELACFDGLLLSEIAERTKESLPNVRHHYYRGVQGLRKFLQAQFDFEVQTREVEGEANDVKS